MWDNRCSIHARTDFPETERRKLRRMTIKDDHPVLMGEPPGLRTVAADDEATAGFLLQPLSEVIGASQRH